MLLNVDVLPQQARLLQSVMMDYDAELAAISIARSVLSCLDESAHEACSPASSGWMTGTWWGEVCQIEKKKQVPLTKQMVVVDMRNRSQIFVSNDIRPRVSMSVAEQEERMLCSLLTKVSAERIKGKPTKQSINSAIAKGCLEMLADGAEPALILADVNIGAQFSSPTFGIPSRSGHRVVRLPDDWHIKLPIGDEVFDEHIPARWSGCLSGNPRHGVSNIFIFGRGSKGIMFHSGVLELVPDHIFGETLCMMLYDNALTKRITCDWLA